MAISVLGAASIASFIARSLPQDADPQITRPVEAVAIACHAGMLAVGFRILGLGEDHKIDMPADVDAPTRLPPQWNAYSGSSIDFRYSHPQSSMQFLLKVSRLGAKSVIYGIGIGDDKTTSFDITTKDFISESALPASPAKANVVSENITDAITTIFVTPSRLTDLGSMLRLNVIQKLVPSLQKEGYEDTSSTQSSTARQVRSPCSRSPSEAHPSYVPPGHDPYQPARPNPLIDPSFGPARRFVPPGEMPPPEFEDPYDINRPHRDLPRSVAGGVPRYGERDLYPPGLGPRDSLYGGIGPGLGQREGERGGGGMHMDFEDFEGRGGPGGDLRAPPGARYDPPSGLREPPIDPLMGDRAGRSGGQRLPGAGGFGGPGSAPLNPSGGFGARDFM